MTREALFRTTLESQFALASGWNAVLATAVESLAESDIPSFAVLPGATKFTAFDGSGHPTVGTQEITFRIFFSYPSRDWLNMLQTRSDCILTLESFLATGFAPPAPGIGDTIRIDAFTISNIDAPGPPRADGRAAITAHGLYGFTYL